MTFGNLNGVFYLWWLLPMQVWFVSWSDKRCEWDWLHFFEKFVNSSTLINTFWRWNLRHKESTIIQKGDAEIERDKKMLRGEYGFHHSKIIIWCKLHDKKPVLYMLMVWVEYLTQWGEHRAQPLTIITKRFILDVAAVLDPPLAL